MVITIKGKKYLLKKWRLAWLVVYGLRLLGALGLMALLLYFGFFSFIF